MRLKQWTIGATVLLVFSTTAWAQEVDPDEILLNPGFELDADENGLPDAWNVSAERILWREDVFMSRNYTITSRRPAYVIATQGITLEKGMPYTLTIRCKGTGGGIAGALLLHGETRPEREMQLLWNLRTGDDYEEYVRTFIAPNPRASIYLYNLAKDTGSVTYDRVSLRRGLPDRVVISKLSFRDIDQPIGPPLSTPHIDWASPLAGGPLKAFITLRSFRCLRQVTELEQRLDLDSDIVHTGYEGNESACTTAGRAMTRLQNREYDLYVVPSRTSDILAETIRDSVSQGAGLVIVEGFGRAAQVLDNTPLETISPEHWLLRGVPWDLMPEKLLDRVEIGTLGQGRVVRLVFPPDTGRVWGLLPTEIGYTAWRNREFEYWEWWELLLAKACAWAARGAPNTRMEISGPEMNRLQVTSTNAAPESRLRYSFRSIRELRFSEPPLRTATVEQPLPPDHPLQLTLPGTLPAGDLIFDWQLLDPSGAVTDWGSHACSTPQQVTIGNLAGSVVGPPGNRACEARLDLTAVTAVDAEIVLTLIDALGRAVSRASRPLTLTPGPHPVTLRAPLRTPLTVLQRAFVSVTVNGREEDSAWTALYLPEVGPATAAADFTAIPWRPGMSHPLITGHYTTLTREIGLNGDFPGDPFLNAETGLPAAAYLGGMAMFRETAHADDGIRSRCLHDPKVIADMENRAREAAINHRGSGLFAVGIADEAFLSSRHQRSEFCFSEATQAAYRDWLRRQYGSLEALNRQWGTTHQTWDEVRGARTEDVRGRDNAAPFVDFRTFMTDTWIEACRRVTRAYQEINPGVPVGHTNTFGANPFNGNDYWKLASQTGFGWGQEYSEAIKGSAHKAVFDLWRSFVETPEARQSRSATGSAAPFFNYGWIGYQHSLQAAHYEPWWLALHGARGVSYYATNAIDAGRGISWALVYPSQSLTPYSLAVKDALQDLREGCGKLLLEYEREIPRIGILWSHPSMLAAWCESAWDHPEPDERPGTDSYGAYFRSALSIRQHLAENQLDYRYLAPQQILQGDALSQVDLLFLPFSIAVSDDLVAALEGFVDRGGVLVGDVRCLRSDAHGTPSPTDRLEQLFGVSRAPSARMIYGASQLSVERSAPGLSLPRGTVEVFARETIVAAGATALARHATGEPAVLVARRGAGTSIYLNALLPDPSPTTGTLIARIAALAGSVSPVVVEPANDSTTARCYERNTFRRGKLRVHGFIRDFRRCSDRDPVRLRFAEPAHVYNVRERRYLGETQSVETSLPPGETALFACLPYAVDSLHIDAPTSTERGADLPVSLRLQPRNAPPGDHIIRLEVFAADGQRLQAYDRNLPATAGQVSVTLPLALNDVPGTWRLQARDVLSGTTAERVISVR